LRELSCDKEEFRLATRNKNALAIRLGRNAEWSGIDFLIRHKLMLDEVWNTVRSRCGLERKGILKSLKWVRIYILCSIVHTHCIPIKFRNFPSIQ
jgi:uncharacterized membrane protein (DUF106 family)